MANLIEEGDEVVVGVNGAFGGRLAEVAHRMGAKVHKVEAEWGRIVEPDQIAQALSKIHRPKLVAIVHSETSTGIHQPLDEIAKMTHRSGALLVIDGVTSLGACRSKSTNGASTRATAAPRRASARRRDSRR